MGHQPQKIISPAIKWAQSKNEIYLLVKLSLRGDSPSCTNCKLEKLEIKDNQIYLDSFGIFTHLPVKFQLNLTLFLEIVPENSTWKEESAGSFAFNLTKKVENSLWNRLGKEN
jgi:hypothetical protein